MKKTAKVKPLTKKQIADKIKEVVANGQWMIRRSNNGVSCASEANGFKWNPIGVWTEAPDWNPKSECGGGLHGNGPKSTGYWTKGNRLEFCAVEDVVDIYGEKIKCRRAMILMVNNLPDGISVGSSLYLGGCDLKGVTLPQEVGGYLDLNGCDLEGVTLPHRFKGKIIK